MANGFNLFRELYATDPLMGVAFTAGVVALATIPIAFAVLGRMDWFQARRGRTYMRPAFGSVVCLMMLTMGVPAVFCALVVKSRSFDKNRYEYDPNTVWSPLEQGRGLRSLHEADAAVKVEMERLAEVRKNLVNNVKKLDESMLALRAVAGQSPAVAQSMPAVLQTLAKVRESVGVDAPQQLMDFTAPPAAIPTERSVATTSSSSSSAAPTTAPVSPPAGAGLSEAVRSGELATVPEPQRALAGMLPLADLPPGWTVGKSGAKHLETFNADNLFEKIDGRAESFLQYDVKGMAYTFYHPVGDESNEVQVYIFEMGDALKALGKYGSEKPDGVAALPIGSEGYASAGSTLFYAGKYYTQIVSTKDDPKFAAFALELAKRIVAKQTGGSDDSPAATKTANEPKQVKPKPKSGPEAIMALLPTEPKRAGVKYVAQDVFGYSFLSNVFMADYSKGDKTWQGFLRPYENTEEAKAVFEKYLDGAKQDGAEVKKVDADGADKMVVSSNIGLVDVIFLKGNVVGGVNGATDAGLAEAFARTFAKALPDSAPFIAPEAKTIRDDAKDQ